MWAIAQDFVNPNLLFAGTEFGLFFSPDAGKPSIETSGDIDLRGFLGLDPSVKAGYDALDITVHVKAKATPEQIERVHDFVARTSPNRFNLAQPVRLRSRLVASGS